jgi:Cytochrome c
MRTIRPFLFAFSFLLALLAASAAARAAKEPTGQEVYKEHCKSCHGPDAKAGEYAPLTLTQEQWERFFDKKFQPSHKNVVDEKHGGKVPDVITPEMLKKIRKFAVDHAADSESPATCG